MKQKIADIRRITEGKNNFTIDTIVLIAHISFSKNKDVNIVTYYTEMILSTCTILTSTVIGVLGF